jgi:peroxiredoxin
LEKLWKEYQAQGVQVIGVNAFETRRNRHAAPEKKAEEFKTKYGLTFPIILDDGETFYWKFGMGPLPWNVIIDQNRVVRFSAPGVQLQAMRQTIKSLLNKKK